MSTPDLRVVLVTAPEGEPAESLAETLVSERLAACVNHVRGVRSVYRWEGSLQRDQEDLLIIKTTASGFGALEERIRQLHPYEVPEILALDVQEGSQAYMAWVSGEVR